MAAEATAVTEFWRFLGQAVTIISGWIVVHKLSSARDRDKARREMVVKTADSLSEAVDKLLLNARTYHMALRDVNLEVQIKMALQDASIRSGALISICNASSELAACRCGITSLKQAITSKHFEDEHTELLDANHQQLQDIAAEVLRSKQALLRLKHAQL